MGKPSKRRIVLLTGAAGGIGTALAMALASAGHAIGAVDCDELGLARLAKEVGTRAPVFPVAADLAVATECEDAVNRTLAHFGRVDAVINNAGIGLSRLRPDAERRHPMIEELTAEVWDHYFAVNVRAALIVTRASVSDMKKRGWGRIINNTTSYRTMLRALPYGATKAALESMAAIWATELKGFGITVNVLVPGGPTDTALIADEAGWPRHEMLRPEIMGPPAVWLLSDASNAISGQRITAKKWDCSLPHEEAFCGATRLIGWPELADQPAKWQQ